MATKKQNRRETVRRVRRALKRTWEAFGQLSGRRLNRFYYGGGINQKTLGKLRQVDATEE